MSKTPHCVNILLQLAARSSAGSENGSVVSPSPQKKNLKAPDETLTFPKGTASTVRVGDLVVGRLEQQPGWHWSEQVKPIAGTESCQFHHIGVGISGAAMIRMDDGTEVLIEAGDVFDIPPGHDQWVVRRTETPKPSD